MEKEYIKNREDLILLGSLFLLYFLLIKDVYYDRATIELTNKFPMYILTIFTLVIRTVPTYYATKSSKELNRSKSLWGLITFISPFVGLVILSKLNYNFQAELNNLCSPILKKFKNEFKSLRVDLHSKNLNKIEYTKKRKWLEKEYNEKLNGIIYKYEKDQTKFFNTVQPVELTETVADQNNLSSEYEFCPACNSKLNKDVNNCPDCGLYYK